MIRRFLRADRGAAIIEFAIVTPVLIALLLGTIEVGRYTYMGIVAAHAAHAAVQYAAQNPTTALNVTAIKNAATADTPNPSSWTVRRRISAKPTELLYSAQPTMFKRSRPPWSTTSRSASPVRLRRCCSIPTSEPHPGHGDGVHAGDQSMTAFRHGQRGASSPETAIVVGVLLPLLLGIVEFGRRCTVTPLSPRRRVRRRVGRSSAARSARCWITAMRPPTKSMLTRRASARVDAGSDRYGDWVNCRRAVRGTHPAAPCR